MAVQLRYLFGGADLVELTPGLSYAEYARRGFFELVAATALVVPILLLADWVVAPDTSRSRNVLRATMLVLVVDRKSTRLNSSHSQISYAVFCLKKKKNK